MWADPSVSIDLCSFGGNPSGTYCAGDPVGDFDGDQRLEVVEVDRTAGMARIFDAMTGQMEFETALPSTVFRWARAVDLNNDGVSEAIIHGQGVGFAVIGFAGLTTPVADEVPRRTATQAFVHPNPFNPAATIDYSLPATGSARLGIYDASGRLVRSLVDGTLEAGPQSVIWDGRDNVGHVLSSGTYFYELRLDGKTLDSGKAVILK